MSEQPARDARAPHEVAEHLTFKEAGRIILRSYTERCAYACASWLISVSSNKEPCTFVVWPQPERAAHLHDAYARDARADERSGVQDDPTLERLVTQLRDENAFLRADVDYLRQTLDAEMEARRRADHLVAALMERLPELPATVSKMDTHVDAPQGSTSAPPRDDLTTEVSTAMSAPQGSGLRRWWRRITGGG